MSATSGTLTCFLISLNASAASIVGTETRTISPPTATIRFIWSTVAATSVVRVFVIDWTAMGAPSPMGTLPTLIRVDFLRLIGLSANI